MAFDNQVHKEGTDKVKVPALHLVYCNTPSSGSSPWMCHCVDLSETSVFYSIFHILSLLPGAVQLQCSLVTATFPQGSGAERPGPPTNLTTPNKRTGWKFSLTVKMV